MDHFEYRDGVMHAEDVPLATIADQVGTPAYVYSTATLERHFRVFLDAFGDLRPTVCFAVKANANLAVLRTLARLGAGADVVSGGELRIALAAGIPPARIVFSGVGKTADELETALLAGVHQINVESEPELEAISRVAARTGRTAAIALRVNPDVDALTHAKIATGLGETKFGIEWAAAHRIYDHAAQLPGLKIAGVAVHIGSQLTDLEPFRQAFLRVADLVRMVRQDGHTIETIDLGGGLGIPYGNESVPPPSPDAYAAVVRETVGGLGCRLVVEPGRLIVGNAGVLLSRVIYVKEGALRTFVIIDAGMNDLIRPSLYDAYHDVEPVRAALPEAPRLEADVVGPVCETGDRFAVARQLPPLAGGDLVVLRSAGAYGSVMSSTYNGRPLVPEVMVSGDRYAVVRERITIDDLLARQKLPEWLQGAGDG